MNCVPSHTCLCNGLGLNRTWAPYIGYSRDCFQNHLHLNYGGTSFGLMALWPYVMSVHDDHFHFTHQSDYTVTEGLILVRVQIPMFTRKMNTAISWTVFSNVYDITRSYGDALNPSASTCKEWVDRVGVIRLTAVLSCNSRQSSNGAKYCSSVALSRGWIYIHVRNKKLKSSVSRRHLQLHNGRVDSDLTFLRLRAS